MRLVRSTIALLLLLAALPATAQMTREEAMKLAEQYRGKMGTVQTEVPEPIELTEADLSGFISTVTELRELGVSTELAGAETDPTRMARALSANEAAYGILKSNGFTPDRFQTVMFSIALALGVVEGDLDAGQIDAARAAQANALEQMKGRLTQEQIDAVSAGFGTAGSYVDRMRDQPAANIELVRGRLAEIKRALGDKRR